MLQWNTISLSARLHDIPGILYSYNISIALISEFWLLPSSSINIPGFHLIRANKFDGYGGASSWFTNLLGFVYGYWILL